jgi:hypothetical protein
MIFAATVIAVHGEYEAISSPLSVRPLSAIAAASSGVRAEEWSSTTIHLMKQHAIEHRLSFAISRGRSDQIGVRKAKTARTTCVLKTQDS